METFFKAECIMGQATNISVYKSSGFDIVIPTEGWCMGGEDDAGHATSTLFTCDGKFPSIFLNNAIPLNVLTFLPPLFMQVLH